MFYKREISLFLCMGASLAIAQSLGITDAAYPGGCTGGGPCCEPACHVTAYNVGDCGQGDVFFSGNCINNNANPGGTYDLDSYDNCDGYEAEWGVGADGSTPEITIRKKSDGSYNPFAVYDCNAPGAGGGQCVPTGGGCSSKPVFG